MNRKTIVLLAATILAPAHVVEAQKPAKVARIGFLTPEIRTSGHLEAFRQGLRDLEYVEGKNIVIEHAAQRMSPG